MIFHDLNSILGAKNKLFFMMSVKSAKLIRNSPKHELPLEYNIV
jgi:hypothetical protein